MPFGLAQRFRIARDYPTALHLEAALDPRTKSTPALKLIAANLERAYRTPDARLIISVPPQEGKTQLARASIVRQLAIRPETRVVYASHSMELARKHGRWVRDQITANPWLGIQPAKGNAAVNDWRLAHHPGGVLSVGIGSGLTGNPADLAVIDDPVKDREEADSSTFRDRVWDWWTDVLSTRLAPGAPVILIMTRWHEDDLAGRLTTAPDGHLWQVINIPAQADSDPDPLGRQPGEYMISARGARDWEAIKTRVGSRTWAALYQGRPAPAEGGILKRDWWRRWTGTRWLTDEHTRNWCADGTLVQSWDLSFKGTKDSDYVVGQVWQLVGAQAFLLDQVRGRWGFTETVEQIKALTARWPQATAKYVEDKANGPAVIDALSREIAGLVPVNPQGGKESRANAVAPLIEAGNVLLPASAPWVDGLIEEAAGFPNAANDDQVDAMTQALTRLFLTQSRAGSGFYNFG